MNPGDETVRALRLALQHSPENVPLRKHLAETLAGLGRGEEAEIEWRDALRRAPQDEDLKLGLVRAFVALEKRSQALVLLEELIRTSATPARAYLLHARILHREGRIEQAVREYRKAIDADPSVADPELAALLGVGAAEENPWEDVVDGRVRGAAGDEGAEPRDLQVERPAITFDHLGGLEDVKEQVRMKIINPLLHPELYAAYGQRTGGGILLYGPPGCGKTHLARATAGQIRAAFLAIGIHDVLDVWIGASERNLHAIFQQARRAKPCVLFFDEVDALGASRSDMRSAAGRHVINQFLDELDGIHAKNDGILVLAATNAPWHLDAAFRRPGRFDRILFVPPPDEAARAAILRVHLQGKPLGEMDCAAVARKTERFSGADLKGLVETAVEEKLKEAIRRGSPAPIVTKDLLAAAKRVKPTTLEWFATARNYVLYSNEGGLYDELRPWIDR